MKRKIGRVLWRVGIVLFGASQWAFAHADRMAPLEWTDFDTEETK